MSIAASIIAANEVGPAEVGQNYYYQSLPFENFTHEYGIIHLLLFIHKNSSPLSSLVRN